jgi:hypothetical protein
MTIKQQGGIFGRNPTFNDLTVDGSTSLDTLTVDGQLAVDGNVLKVDPTNNRVGVNLDSPATPFHTVGAIRSSNNAASTFQADLANNYLRTNSSNFYFDNFVVGGNFVWRVSNASVGDTTAMTLNSSGNLAFSNGKGIDFSATSGTGTSELFSDYEEGSFTPSLSFVGGSTGITHTLQYGSYRKIGDMVFVMGRIALSSKGSDTGQVRINLPYGVSATSGENGGAALVYGKNFTSVTSDNLTINGVGNTATASMFPATTGTSLTDANILNNTDFIFNFSYIAS